MTVFGALRCSQFICAIYLFCMHAKASKLFIYMWFSLAWRMSMKSKPVLSWCRCAIRRYVNAFLYSARHHQLPKYSLKYPWVADNCAIVNCIPYYGKFCIQFSLQNTRIVHLPRDGSGNTVCWVGPMESHYYGHVNWPQYKFVCSNVHRYACYYQQNGRQYKNEKHQQPIFRTYLCLYPLWKPIQCDV